MRINKRKRSIQRYLDLHVIQEAETEAKLEESTMEEEIVSRENQVFENRRQNVRLEMAIAAARKKTVLEKLANRVEASLDRLAFATECLKEESARKIQRIENEYSREKTANERELQHIQTEEETKRDSHRLRRRDRQVFHGRDVDKAEEDLIAGIQASENEDMFSDDEDIEDEEDAEDEGDKAEEEPQDDLGEVPPRKPRGTRLLGPVVLKPRLIKIYRLACGRGIN